MATAWCASSCESPLSTTAPLPLALAVRCGTKEMMQPCLDLPTCHLFESPFSTPTPVSETAAASEAAGLTESKWLRMAWSDASERCGRAEEAMRAAARRTAGRQLAPELTHARAYMYGVRRTYS